MVRAFRVILFVSIALSLFGCRRTLFAKNQQRNQFQAYNTRRFGPQITEQPNPFGIPKPALRQRLGPQD
jgi:hypothetical protein